MAVRPTWPLVWFVARKGVDWPAPTGRRRNSVRQWSHDRTRGLFHERFCRLVDEHPIFHRRSLPSVRATDRTSTTETNRATCVVHDRSPPRSTERIADRGRSCSFPTTDMCAYTHRELEHTIMRRPLLWPITIEESSLRRRPLQISTMAGAQPKSSYENRRINRRRIHMSRSLRG